MKARAAAFLLATFLAAPAFAMKGVVFSTSGEPVRGARLEFFRSVDDADSKPPVATATAGEDGSFAADLKSDGAVFVVTKSEGLVPARSLVLAAANDVVIQLAAPRPKNGSVRSAKGAVARAKVVAVDTMGDVLATYETDERGRFSMPDPARWAANVCIQHSDYALACTATANGMPTAASLSLDFKLEPGRIVAGHVISAAGKPAGGVRVSAGRLTSTTTREDGTFSIRLATEQKTLRAVRGDDIGSASASAADVTITLAKGRVISGTVRDEGGHALPGARLIAQGENEDSWSTATVDGKGEFAIHGLEPASYNLWVHAPEPFEAEPKQADVRRKPDARVAMTVKRATAIRGTVRDEQRRPVSGAIVMQLMEGMPLVYASGLIFGAQAVTGPDGSFRLYSAQPNTRLAALKKGFAAGVTDRLSEEVVHKPVTITLPRGVEVKGTVVGSDEKSVAGANLVIMSGTTTLGTMPIAASIAAGVIDPWVQTDAHGEFAVRLNAGVHDFGVWKQGYAAREEGNVDVSDALPPIRIQLEPSVAIRGRVVRKNGTAVEGGMVFAVEQSQRGAGEALVGADGSFTIDSLQRGTYMLQYMDETIKGTSTADAPANNAVIELPETVAVSGRVVDRATGTPIRQYTVNVRNGDFFDSNEVENESGQFTQNVTFGETELTINAPGYTTASRSIVVIEGKENPPVEFALAKGRRITGHVTTTDGKPLDQVSLSVDESHTAGSSDEEGEFTLEGAPTDEITIELHKDGFVRTTKTVAAGSADTVVDITMSSGLKVTGRVVDKAGAPVDQAQVSAMSNDGYGNTATDKSGAFTVSGLTAGLYSFTAQKSGLGQAKLEDVDVAKTPPLLLTLGTNPTGRIRGSISGASNGSWMYAMATAVTDDGESDSAQVGRDGTFVIENAPIGEVTVSATLMGMQRQSSTNSVKTVVPNGGEVEVHLNANAGDITVRGVVKSGGQPLSGTTVSFSSAVRSAQWTTQTAADGAYEVSGLEAGHYNVSVMRLGAGEHYQTETDLSSSTTFDINLSFVRIEGRVVDDRGAAVEGAAITAMAVGDPHRTGNAKSDVNGSFTLSVQGDFAYRVSAAKKSFAVATADVSKGSGGPVLLQLHHANGARVRLVDSQTGATLNGFVVVRDQTGKIQIPVNGDRQNDGSLLLPLEDGAYLVSASAGDYASVTIKLAVPSGESKIPLSRGGTLIVNSGQDARELIRLVMPNGEEYVRCYCNGIAEIRLTGAVTKVDHVAGGAYRMDVVDEHEVTKRSYPIVITEGQTTTVDATK